MRQEITPIPVRPWTLNGISERMIVSHYENNYGGAVRTLNAVRAELATLDGTAPGYRLRALKREELIAMNSVALHELYFGNLGGEGNKIPDHIRAMLEQHFGSAGATTRAPSTTPRPPSTPRRCWRSTCTSTPITWTSAPTLMSIGPR